MRSFTLRKISIMALVLSMGMALSQSATRGGDIYITSYYANTVSEYTNIGRSGERFPGLRVEWSGGHRRVRIEPVCRK